MIYVLNILSVVKNDSKGTQRVYFENYYGRIEFAKDNSYYSKKH